ncbi:MAG: glycoside hydrolase family 3 N-terminal domain-containing protein [Thermonemataceae bacterium]
MLKYLLFPLLFFYQTTSVPPLRSSQPSLLAAYFQELKVQRTFDQLTEEERVAQMVVVAAGQYGKKKWQVASLIRNQKIGGVLLLNGTKNEFKGYVKEFNTLTKETGQLPLLYSADAEPSLIHYKIKGTPVFKSTNAITDEAECKEIATRISDELLDIGILHIYAPVCDLTTSNAAIRKRSFGSDTAHVYAMCKAFIEASHQKNILTTAKHFPGHGYVKGDTHKNLVYIDGTLQELDVYKKLLADQVLSSIMVGHIAIKNHPKYDTKGLPATCSRVVVTDLLKEQLGFEGLIVTDAMNLGAVKDIPKASFLAAKAGCDLILMPTDEIAFIKAVVAEMQKDENFRAQIHASVKKIIRYKVAFGLL